MKIYELKDKEGRVFAFEVGNTLLSRRNVCKIVLAIPGARLIKKPCFLSRFREEEFCEFEVHGQKFAACESFGDGSRYWIGPKPPIWNQEVEKVKEVFAHAKPFFGLVRGLTSYTNG